MARSKWSFWRRFWSLLERGSRTAEASLAVSWGGSRAAARKRPPLMVETLEERWVLSPAVLTTDKSDYSPGATAQLIGSGFDPNETVTLAVVHSDTQAPAAGSNNPWTVTTAADGSFSTTWFVNPVDSIGATFTVTASGSDGDSASTAFSDSAPTITSLSQTSAIEGSSSFTLTVNGTGFVSGSSSVQWNGTALSTTFVNSSQLTAIVPTADLAQKGTDTLTVMNADSTTSNGILFTVNDLAPTASITGAPTNPTQGTPITLGSSVTSPIPANQAAGFTESWSAIQNAAGIALQFNGTGGYAITPNLASQFPTTSVTLQLWFKPTGAGVLVSEVGSPLANSPLWHDSQLEVLSNGQVMARVWSMTPVSLGTVTLGSGAIWHSVTLRYNSSTQTLDGFLDGVKSLTSTQGGRQTPMASGFGLYYALGATDSTNLGSGASFNGQIDDFRVWNTALSDNQIQSNMNQQLTGTESGLVAYYRLDDGAGTTMTDQTANHNNGSLVSTVAPGTPGVSGFASSAYQFNGGQIAVNVPQLNTASGTANTVSFWMNWNGTVSVMPIGFTSYDLWFSGNSFGFNTNNGDIYGINAAGLDNQWHYVTAVFNNGNVTGSQLWIDGVQQTLTQQIGTTVTTRTIGSTAARISGWLNDSGYHFGGSLADVSFFSGQLTAAQIQAQYSAVANGNFVSTILGQSPAAFYLLNDPAGSTVAVDSSGNGNNSSAFAPSGTWVASTAPIAAAGSSPVATASTQAPTTQSFPFTFTPSTTGPYSVILTATDKDGLSGTAYATFTVTGGGSGPIVTAQALSATEGTALTNVTVATFTETGNGPHTATIDWGDGTVTAGTVNEPSPANNNTGSVIGSHTYTGAGSATIKVTVTDAAALSGSSTAVVTVTDAAVTATGVGVSAATGATLQSASQLTTTAFIVPAGTLGTQNYNGSLGLDFNVNTPIIITQLGAFDDGSNGLSAPITVRLYNRDTQFVLATLIVRRRQRSRERHAHRRQSVPALGDAHLPAGRLPRHH